METPDVTAVAYGAVFVVGWLLLAWRRPEGRPPHPRRWGLVLVVLVALGFAAQLAWPDLLAAGQRESAAVRAGQWWRLLTAILLQDGGWFGAAFNLATLAVTALLAGPVLDGRLAAAVFVGGGIVANLLTVLTFGQSGAGSSMATMALLVVAVALVLRDPTWRELALVVVLVGVTVLLLVWRDQHGLALVVGLAAGLALRRRRPGAPVSR